MEISIVTYRLDEIPDDIISLIDEEHKLLSNLLSLSTYIDEGNSYDSFIEDLEEYPVKSSLPDSLINKVRKFLEDENIELAYDSTNEDNLKSLFFLRKLLGEQLDYVEHEFEEDCQIYYILAKVDGSPYGGIFCFYNPLINKEVLLFQGIVKYSTHLLISLYSPEYAKRYPKLNSLLQEPIETLARNLGAKRLLVYPIGNQAKILRDYYGYIKSDERYIPCTGILGRENVLAGIGTGYIKFI